METLVEAKPAAKNKNKKAQAPAKKKKGGRPAGSKNKPKEGAAVKPKGKRGRPPGSTAKKKVGRPAKNKANTTTGTISFTLVGEVLILDAAGNSIKKLLLSNNNSKASLEQV